MDRLNSNINRILALIILVATFVGYAVLLAPSISFWDCGEYVAAGSSLAIPHPPGNPLYIVIARVASVVLFFVKDAALRITLVTPVFGAITAMLVYLTIVRLLTGIVGALDTRWKRLCVYLAGMTGSLFAAFGNTVLFCAVEAEVNMPLLLPVMLCTWLAIVWAQSADRRRDRLLLLIAYISYLGIGIHMYSMIALVPVFLLVILTDREKLKDWRLWLTVAALGLVMYSVSWFLWIGSGTVLATLLTSLIKGRNQTKWRFCFWIAVFSVLGFTCQFYIPIRSALRPTIDMNHPSTPQAFIDYLDRKQYGSESMISRMFWRRGTWGHQLGIDEHMGFGGFMLTQFFHLGARDASSSQEFFAGGAGAGTAKLLVYMIPLAVMFFGWYFLFRKSRNLAIFLIMLTLGTTIGLVLYMNFADGTRAELRDYRGWVHSGKRGPVPVVQREVRVRDYFFVAGFMYYGMWIGIAAGGALIALFTSRRKILRGTVAPITAVLVAVSPALPMSQNMPLNDRHRDYIPYDYAYNLLMSCDTNAILFTAGDNDTFPLWAIQEAFGIRRDVRIINLSLLETNWYIKQLKTTEPKVALDYTDDQIDRLSYEYNPLTTPTAFKLNHAGISILLPTQREKQVFYVHDKMVLHIVDVAAWKRPVFFANTVSPEYFMGFERNLSMEGLALRVLPHAATPDEQLNLTRTDHLIDRVFQFRGLDSWRARFDETTGGIARNYAILFIQVAMDMQNRIGQHQRMIDSLSAPMPKAGGTVAPRDTTLLAQERVALDQDLSRGLKRLDQCIALIPWESRAYVARYQILMAAGKVAEAQESIRRGLEQAPTDELLQRVGRSMHGG